MFPSLSLSTRTLGSCLLALAASVGALAVHAEDIDLFVANPLNTSAAAPNIMFMVDNSANWSRQAQKWPDNGGDQGSAELAALRNILASPLNANVGLAMYTKVGNNLGGYVRFGIRDVSSSTAGATNRTALNSILALIQGNINAPVEKVNDNTGEAAALYEIYKYYKSLAPFRGTYSSGGTPNVDIRNNTGSSAGRTAFGQGLGDGYALSVSENRYLGPTSNTCGRSYAILIVNNAQGSIPQGSQTYETVSAGNALPLIPGVSDVSWTDEWARFLYNNGVSVYILDAYNAQQNVSHSKVLQRAARVAGGEYFAVKNQSEIELAIAKILAEIKAINTTFAAASLPISATNRSQNLNQVFIGMFRPDGSAKPRWMGNLKQYQLGRTASGVDLVDRLGINAVNAQTGFLSECAVSLWTTGSGSYWETVSANGLARSGCTVFPTVNGVLGSQWSDMPDGPTVEKGGVAEVLRKGNNPPTTDTSPTWTSNRRVLTYSSSSSSKMTTLTTSVTSWSSTLLSWVTGTDDPAATEFIDTTSTTPARTRPSMHGDVIHSRPLPVNYGAGGVTVYYGANDGMLRAVDASTGRERWAYVAPEHYSAFQRLHDNTPLVNYPNVDPDLHPEPKNYFFDGSFGIYQNLDNSKVWIYPSQRRGGRVLYGFDVTDPASPAIKWRVGCPHLLDDLDCTTGFTGIGQTWSLPSVAFLKGFSETTPVVVVGGGYDSCEDANSSTVTCTSRKGGSIYVLNADTGALLRTFTPTGAGSFAADVAMSDANADGSVDYAYVVDTSGNVFRIDFSDSSGTPLAESSWAIRKVGYTTGGGRKFLYPPALLHVGTKMYVALGSGNRERPLVTNYPYTTPIVNRFYVLLDDLTILPSSSTAAVNMDTDPGMMDYTNPNACGEGGVTPGAILKGWFMNLPGRGEQTVTSALIAAGMVAFNTNRPVATTSDSCSAPLGEARGYWVNLVNGSGAIGAGSSSCGGDRSSVFVGGGLTPSPTLATVVIDGRTTTVAIGAANREGGPSVTIDPQEVKPTIHSRRRTIYWKSNAAD